MKMKTIFIKSFVILFVLFWTFNTTNAQIKMLSGIPNGSYDQIAEDVKWQIERDIKSAKSQIKKSSDPDEIAREKAVIKGLEYIKPDITTSSGSMDNFEQLTKRTGVDIAFLQYDVIVHQQLEDLREGTYDVEDIKILFPMGNEHIHLLVRADSDIESLDDLRERNQKNWKKVATGSSRSGTYITASVISQRTGIQWLDVPLSFENGFNALTKANSTIDAIFFVGAIPVERFAKLPAASDRLIKIIPITNPELEKDYIKTLIPAGTYKWANYDVETYAVKSVMATSVAHQSPETKEKINKFLEYIYLNIEKLKEGTRFHKFHTSWQQVDFNFQDFDPNLIYEEIEFIFDQ